MNLTRTVSYPTDPLLIFLLRRVNCRMNWMPVTDPDQSLSEEQSYRETMRGIRSFMGWTLIPNMDTAAGSSDVNPFAGPRL